MKKSPIEIVRLNPVYKEKIDSKSAKLLRKKLYELSSESVINELPLTHKRKGTKNVNAGYSKKSIAVPPLPNVGSDGLLPLQVCSWLIYTHLLRWGYRCTIASFQSESHLSGSPENTFTIFDVLDLLGIPRDSMFYTNFLAEYNEMENRGVLYTLLKHCIKNRIMKPSTDVAIQVNSEEKVKSITEKFKEIDEIFKEKQQKLWQSSGSSESQNSRAKSITGNNEISEIERKIEIENIRTREKMIFEDELEHMRSRMKEEYEARLRILQQKQMEYQTEMQRKRELEQQEINRLKNQFIQELDNLQKFGEAARKEVEEKQSFLEAEEKILLEKKNELQMKEYELEKCRIQAAVMSEEIASNFHRTSAEKIEQKLAELRSWEEKLRNETERLQERHEESKKADEVNYLRQKLHELELSLKSLQDKYSAVVKQNTKLSNKLDSMADYNSVKTELSYAKKELETVKEHLVETRKEAMYAAKSNIQNLRNQAIPERKETTNVAPLSLSDQSLLQERCRRLENEIEELHRLNKRIIVRNDQQQQEIEDLRQTLKSFEKHLYSSENKFSDFPFKDNKITVLSSASTKQASAHLSLWENKTNEPLPFTSRRHNTTSLPYSLSKAQTFDKEKPLRFITEARKRIDYLQVEAEALEKKYGEYLQSQAKSFWSIPTSVNTMFSSAEHSLLSRNLYGASRAYDPYSTSSKFSAQNIYSFPEFRNPSKAFTSTYPIVGSISKGSKGARPHLAESTHISIQQESPQDSSESNIAGKDKYVVDIQLLHKASSFHDKENRTEELKENKEKLETDKEYKNTHNPSSESKEVNSIEPNSYCTKSKEVPVHEGEKGLPESEHSANNVKSQDGSLKFNKSLDEEKSYNNELGKDHSLKSQGDSLKSNRSVSKEKSHHTKAEIQSSAQAHEKPEKQSPQNTSQDSMPEKPSLEKDHAKEDSVALAINISEVGQVEQDNSPSKKHFSNDNIEGDINLSTSQSRNMHTLPSAANNAEKFQDILDENISVEADKSGDVMQVNVRKSSSSSKKTENVNSSSHNTDAPDVSELSISAGSIGHASKGEESDFW